MDFSVRSTERAKRVAKTLAESLSRRGVAGFPYSRCLDVVAAMYGLPSYASLADRCRQPAPSSLDDAEVSAETVVARREWHVAVLTREGVDRSLASAIIDEIRPTDRADRRKAAMFQKIDLARWAHPGRTPEALIARRRRLAAAQFGVSRFVEQDADVDLLDDRVMHLFGGQDPMSAERSDMLALALLDAADAVADIEEVKSALLHAIARAVEAGVRTERSKRMARAIPSDFQAVGVDPVVLEPLTRFAESTAYPATMARLASHSFFNMHGELAHLCGYLDQAGAAGATVSDLAAAIGFLGYAPVPCSAEHGVSTFGEALDLWLLYRGRKTARRLVIPRPDDADAAVLAAVHAVEKRGYPKIFREEIGYFNGPSDEGLQERFFVRPDGSMALASDVLVGAHAAGYGMEDLVDASAVASRFVAGASPKWAAALDSIRKPVRDPHPDLVAAALCYGLVPKFSYRSESSWIDPFLSAFRDLEELAASGFDLVSVAACACIGDLAVGPVEGDPDLALRRTGGSRRSVRRPKPEEPPEESGNISATLPHP
jgi:hypothetical protein